MACTRYETTDTCPLTTSVSAGMPERAASSGEDPRGREGEGDREEGGEGGEKETEREREGARARDSARWEARGDDEGIVGDEGAARGDEEGSGWREGAEEPNQSGVERVPMTVARIAQSELLPDHGTLLARPTWLCSKVKMARV